MNDPILQKFLARQLVEGLALSAASDLVTIVPFAGDPPTHYVVEFTCLGLARERGHIVERDQWAIGVHFPESHLRQPGDVAHQLTYLGAAAEPWYANIRRPFVCMHIAPGASLVEIVMGLFDLLTWTVFATGDDGLNPAASQWARQQDASRFPVDRRPLRRRAVALEVRP